MESIMLGTIGTGKIVHEILNNVIITPGISLNAVYSRSEEKGQKLAEEYGCDKVYTDIAGFLSDSDINTVYIASPNSLHYGQAEAALLAGKNVICEKPFVTSRRQAEALADLAENSGLMIAEAAPTAYLPNFRVLKENLPRVGRLRAVISNYSKYSSRYDDLLRGEKPNIFNPQFGGGCLMDINYYNILLNVLLFGTPLKAEYYCSRFPGMADISGTAVLEYDGFTSSNTGAKDTWGVDFFQIEGEDGYIYIDGGSNGIKEVRVVTRESDETYQEQPCPNRWYYEVQELTRIFLTEDRDALRSHMDTTIKVMSLLEELRLKTGIRFPSDD